MSLQADIRSAFAALKIAFPDLVVAVVSGAQSAQGIRYSARETAALTDDGEQGLNIGHVRVDSSELSTPERGATITVAGQDVFVVETVPDEAGALLEIRYQLQRPISGPLDVQ